mgnify:CR=1 FL=1
MKYIQIFDFVRHLLEFFFFVVTGPLVTAVAVKKIRQRKDLKQQVLELQERVVQLETEKKQLVGKQ